jgi:hypothetical protein
MTVFYEILTRNKYNLRQSFVTVMINILLAKTSDPKVEEWLVSV